MNYISIRQLISVVADNSKCRSHSVEQSTVTLSHRACVALAW